MELGVIIPLNKETPDKFKQLKELGFSTCQLNHWDPMKLTDDDAKMVNDAMKEYDVKVSAFWCGWSGPMVWDFYSGPHTLGVVPSEYRNMRIKELKYGSDFAKKIGVEDIVTHVGFIPEVPTSTEYEKLVITMRDLVQYVKDNNQYFLFETGQETPVTLRRLIEDIGTDNLGINLDPANLIMYGKANPIDALDVFGEFVRNIHGKDGCYPTDGKNLGNEAKMGEGKVNYPKFIEKLKSINYDRYITIEREISGKEQIDDIIHAKNLLESLL